jgi:hypothetical protein
MEEIVGAALEAITRIPRKSVPHLAQQIGMSTSTARKIRHQDSSLLPYEMQHSQPLWENGMRRRYAFAREHGALLEYSFSVTVSQVCGTVCGKFHSIVFHNRGVIQM